MLVSNQKNIATSLNVCKKCSNCNEISCRQCQHCLTPEVRYQLKEAFREHQNSANWKRVFPASEHFDDEELFDELTEINQIQLKWSKGKCEQDEKWC